jgi:carboxypeptidase T
LTEVPRGISPLGMISRLPRLLLLSAGLATAADAWAATRYQELQASMRKIVAGHPGVARMFDVGPSDAGETIQGVRIGNGPARHLVLGGHHGDEIVAQAVVMELLRESAAHPLAGVSLYVVPVMNIGGYNGNRRDEKDANGVDRDPNRAYPGPCGSYEPAFILRSARSLDAFLRSEGIVSAVDVHDGSALAAYPWSTGYVLRPDDDADFLRLAGLLTQFSGFKYDVASEFWSHRGVFKDYAYWNYGIWALLLEVSEDPNPSAPDLAQAVEVNVRGLVAFLKGAPAKRSGKHSFKHSCS